MKKYRAFFKCYLAANFEHRAAMITWALIELVSVASAIFLWLAIYRGQTEVGGYELNRMMLYYALVPLIGSLTYTYVSSSLPNQIKDGRISADLLRPYSLAASRFLESATIKINQQLFKAPIFFILIGVVFYLFRFSLGVKNIILALFFSLFSYFLHFFIDLCLSYTAFWIDDVWSLKHLKWVAIMMFGGVIFPLDIVPQAFRGIFNFLPFRFIYFFPIAITQGGVSIDQIISQFLQLLVWLLFFCLLSKVLWKYGLRKYGAYGN